MAPVTVLDLEAGGEELRQVHPRDLLAGRTQARFALERLGEHVEPFAEASGAKLFEPGLRAGGIEDLGREAHAKSEPPSTLTFAPVM